MESRLVRVKHADSGFIGPVGPLRSMTVKYKFLLMTVLVGDISCMVLVWHELYIHMIHSVCCIYFSGFIQTMKVQSYNEV